ncbi:unnamed protein product [Effrenium voratum]|uniref:Uncharacterized protein n=1 Tax=Effrenium voratum TaxID=2562239 RepID=A0AA36IIY4_9DINO|nr:unnamed protein product [Effrenium voratum]
MMARQHGIRPAQGALQENAVPASALRAKEADKEAGKELREQRSSITACGNSSSSISGQRSSITACGNSSSSVSGRGTLGLGSLVPRKRPAPEFEIFHDPDTAATAATPPRNIRYRRQVSPSSTDSRATPASVSEGRRLQRTDTQGTSMSESMESNQENKPPEDLEATPEREPPTHLVRSPEPSGLRTPLRDLQINHLPEGAQEQTPDSPPSSQESPERSSVQNLAELQEERIARNEGGRYDFTFYVDPENR